MNNPDINLSTILSDVFKKTSKKAEQGNADEQFHLGIMYVMGHGTDRDFTKARLWFEKAANQDNSLAKTAVAYLDKINPVA
ncbi:tetratricopeptide repeat protein [Budvicia aquatica]|uniref:Sel1 repeat n=1 Tax=Budvicia aquatica TaxID=82979 RepID=A0A2C6DJI5_9GAMM|nr:SEL1-like repeat protein [Budvicia aquatica]PHI30478.1 sel1 repeat family protein [Budvicia aquatica]VFS49695.1 Sel1 repeat [Budvicia aquatica]